MVASGRAGAAASARGAVQGRARRVSSWTATHEARGSNAKIGGVALAPVAGALPAKAASVKEKFLNNFGGMVVAAAACPTWNIGPKVDEIDLAKYGGWSA